MIQGEGGIYPISSEYVAESPRIGRPLQRTAGLRRDPMRRRTDRRHIIAYQRSSPPVLPDIMVTAKPLACGLPLGAIVANEKAAATIAPGMHGSTFGGSALACRVALEFFDILEGLLPDIQRVGGYLHLMLNELARKHAIIKEVRGFGLMIGVELEIPGKQIVLDAIEEGLLINCTHETVLRFLPPYIVTERDVDAAIKILGKILAKQKGAPA